MLFLIYIFLSAVQCQFILDLPISVCTDWGKYNNALCSNKYGQDSGKMALELITFQDIERNTKCSLLSQFFKSFGNCFDYVITIKTTNKNGTTFFSRIRFIQNYEVETTISPDTELIYIELFLDLPALSGHEFVDSININMKTLITQDNSEVEIGPVKIIFNFFKNSQTPLNGIQWGYGSIDDINTFAKLSSTKARAFVPNKSSIIAIRYNNQTKFLNMTKITFPYTLDFDGKFFNLNKIPTDLSVDGNGIDKFTIFIGGEKENKDLLYRNGMYIKDEFFYDFVNFIKELYKYFVAISGDKNKVFVSMDTSNRILLNRQLYLHLKDDIHIIDHVGSSIQDFYNTHIPNDGNHSFIYVTNHNEPISQSLNDFDMVDLNYKLAIRFLKNASQEDLNSINDTNQNEIAINAPANKLFMLNLLKLAIGKAYCPGVRLSNEKVLECDNDTPINTGCPINCNRYIETNIVTMEIVCKSIGGNPRFIESDIIDQLLGCICGVDQDIIHNYDEEEDYYACVNLKKKKR